MRKLIWMLTIVAVASLTASTVQADVLVKFHEVDPGVKVNVYSPFDPSGDKITIGVFNVEVDLGNGDPSFMTSAFCIDLKQVASHGWKAYDIEPLEVSPKDGGSDYSPMGAAKANAIRELWGEHFADVVDASSAAAFQAAIWEVIYENSNTAASLNGWDLTGGNLSIDDAGVAATANAWLADVGDSSTTLETSLLALTNFVKTNQWQDYVFSQPGGQRPPVPEPMTVATMAMALSGLGVYVRRRTVA